MKPQPIEKTFSDLTGSNIKSLERLAGGRNNQTYRIITTDGRTFAGKKYFRSNTDPRNRLDVEFSSLQYLRRHGIRSVPRPIRSDPQNGCALYEFIEGQRLDPGQAARAGIDQMVEFLAQLKRLATEPYSKSLPAASEACFSGQDVADTVFFRLQRLQQHGQPADSNDELHLFLEHHYIPAAEKLIGRCKQVYRKNDLCFEAGIRPEEQTLSPSDFGFHNALVRPDGTMVFLDFEYFGWDDPSKMICDVLLHPAMGLSAPYRKRFLAQTLSLFNEQKQLLKHRVQTLYPLHGLKWCLILLNEFIPDEQHRRGFAGTIDDGLQKQQTRQLAKAGAMLQKTLNQRPVP